MSNAPQNPLWAAPLRAALAPALPPWVSPPEGADPFDFFGVIDTPAVGAGETEVLTFVVPAGYLGVICDLTHLVEGPSLQEGSGDLIWRLRFDRQTVKNYGDIRVSFGDLASPRSVYSLRMRPRQKVVYTVENVAYLPAGSRIICGCRGWFYPEVQR